MPSRVTQQQITVARAAIEIARTEQDTVLRSLETLESLKSSIDGFSVSHNDYVKLLRHLDELQKRLREIASRVDAYQCMYDLLQEVYANGPGDPAAQPNHEAPEPEPFPRRRRIRMREQGDTQQG